MSKDYAGFCSSSTLMSTCQPGEILRQKGCHTSYIWQSEPQIALVVTLTTANKRRSI